ncbi:MAG: M36 family metallopeptidase [Myxococcales bacterium]|nr:M36 family metallopeptidase [Myxococcales bacterium]
MIGRNVIAAGFVLSLGACTDESAEIGGTPQADAETTDVAVDAPEDVAQDGVDTPDSMATDIAVPDSEDAPDTTGPPRALVFEENPIDSPSPVEVVLTDLNPQQKGRLTGGYANVQNCVADKDAGKAMPVEFGGFKLDLTLCAPKYTALPEDGVYTHITPPETQSIDSDAFAEVMMYHHIQRIHGYFKDGFGLTDLDYPLDALVNVQVHVALCDSWAAFGNALFTPEGSFNFGIDFDFGFEGAAIIFGQTADKDFAYEADVIAHEYTHAMIGATRLNAITVDEQGLSNLAGALNEGYADYFACTTAGDSVIGNYALNAVAGLTVCGVPLSTSGNLARDLATFRTCPADLTAEVHADGEIFASALWAIRDALGAEKADAVILGALVGFTQSTGFTEAAQATLAEAQATLDAGDAAAVEKAFGDRGLLACERVIPANRVGVRGIPLTFEAGGALGNGPLGPVTPGYVQIGFLVPEGASSVDLVLEVGGGAGDVDADAVVKAGGSAVQLGGGPGSGHDGVARIALRKGASNKELVVTLSGSCLSPGPWSAAILNEGDGFAVISARLEISPEGGDANTLGCP